MRIHSEKVRKAIENIKKYLTENEIEYADFQDLSPSVCPQFKDNGIIIRTHTTLFETFRVKYIYVTPEQVAIIGKNIPYNHTKWQTLQAQTYSTKTEMLDLINRYIYNPKIDEIWLND